MVKDHSDIWLLFPVSSKCPFLCTIPQTEYHTPRPLLHQSWSTNWNKKYFKGSTIRDRSDNPSHHELMLYHGAISGNDGTFENPKFVLLPRCEPSTYKPISI